MGEARRRKLARTYPKPGSRKQAEASADLLIVQDDPSGSALRELIQERGAESFAAIQAEIGAASHLTPEDAARCALIVVQGMVDIPPTIEIGVTIGGYDDDPRELTEIAEVREYVRQFVRAMRAVAPVGWEDRLDQPSRNFLLEMLAISSPSTPV